MFELTKVYHFEAGHQLKYHKGKCQKPHGHSYVLEVHLKSHTLCDKGSEKNMVIDFSKVSEFVKPMIKSHLDHHWLNETLETDSPTAEFIARWIYYHLKEKLPLLDAITLWETKSSKVTYRPIL